MTEQDFVRAWSLLLQEVALANAYPLAYQVTGSPVGRNQVVEMLLPWLLYVRLASTADEGLETYIETRGITCTHPLATGKPAHQKQDLFNRTRCLEASQLLSEANAAGLDQVRTRRKDLAHDALPNHPSWSELDAAIELVRAALIQLALVQPNAPYSVTAVQEAARPSEKTGVLCEQEVALVLRQGDKPIRDIRWTLLFWKDGHL